MADSNRLRGKYARIDRPEDSPRPSLEAGYRDTSDEEDIDEFDPLNYDQGTLKRKGSKYQKAKKDGISAAGPVARKGWGRRLMPGRTCCWIMLLFVASFILLVSAGGIWVWKLAPKT